MKLGTLLSCALLGTLLVGCGAPGFKSKAAKNAANAKADQPAQTQTTSGDLQGGMNPLANQAPAVWTPNLTVSDAIAKACGIAPKGDGKQMQASFGYDSTVLQDED